jgi:hypothetical protein
MARPAVCALFRASKPASLARQRNYPGLFGVVKVDFERLQAARLTLVSIQPAIVSMLTIMGSREPVM